ncbi:MAG TPA: CdaR family protein [Nitrospirota bacterium]|nr:CdaR family protein [Nitrospirota bacterium]
MDFRKIILDNWGIKLLSIALSLTLWFFVTSKGKTELTLTVPVELRNIPQDMAVVGDVTSSLEVRVQGQERVLRDITIGKKVVCIADLSMTKVGENTVRISPDDIKRPADVAVTYMSLSEIRVKLEPVMLKTFRLKPILHGSPAAGFHVAKISVSPSRITLEAPTGVMQTLDRLQTMPIDIQGAHENLTVEPKVDYQGKQVKILEKNITVHITLERTRQ